MNNSMNIISFSFDNGRGQLDVGSGTCWNVSECAGLEASEYEITTQPDAQLDGGLVLGRRVCPRRVRITAECRRADDGSLRAALIAFFDPKRGGTLTATVGQISRRIDYEVSSFEFRHKTALDPLRFTVTLLCPSPYWRDLNGFSKNMAGVIPMLAFPLVLPPRKLVMSRREMQHEAVIANPGSKAVGLDVQFVATRGSVVNPMLSNLTTGQYFRILLTMSQGDKLDVCTVPGRKRVELNGENAIQHIDRASSFFLLASGDTVLEYDADSNKQNLDVYPRFTPEYLGI